MGIGSFFASLFQKEEDDRRKIRELDLAPEKIERTSADAATGLDSTKKEKTSKEQMSAPKKTEEDINAGGRTVNRPKDRPGKKQAQSGKKTAQGQETDLKINSDRQKEQRQEADGLKKGKKDLYQYLNQTMRTLYQADQEDGWESLPALDPAADNITQILDKIREEIPESLMGLLLPFMDENNQAEPASLKPAFYAMLLPFYPMYKSYFEDFKFNTFLNREALDLFRRLTGRKFRLGYRNRYPEGHNAFEWKGETYKVYDRNGGLLCDAVFSDGSVKDGYAVLAEEESTDPAWAVRRKGVFVVGQFTDGAVEYIFKKSIL